MSLFVILNIVQKYTFWEYRIQYCEGYYCYVFTIMLDMDKSSKNKKQNQWHPLQIREKTCVVKKADWIKKEIVCPKK